MGGRTFLGSGYYFGSYSPADLLKLSGELPELVASGVNMGVMLTLSGSNSSVQRVFFDAAERAGFKVIWPLFFMTGLDANQTKQVKAMGREPCLLGYYIADDGCKAHGWISLLAQGYNDLKRIDPLRATFGSVNCDSPWLFSDKPSFLPPDATAAKTVWLGAGQQPRTQLSLDVPLLENYGSLSGQMGNGRWAGGPKRDGDFRHGIPFTPLGNCLEPPKFNPLHRPCCVLGSDRLGGPPRDHEELHGQRHVAAARPRRNRHRRCLPRHGLHRERPPEA